MRVSLSTVSTTCFDPWYATQIQHLIEIVHDGKAIGVHLISVPLFLPVFLMILKPRMTKTNGSGLERRQSVTERMTATRELILIRLCFLHFNEQSP